MDSSWLTHSFEEHTIAWLLISTILGSGMGSAITLFLDEVVRPQIALTRGLKKIFRTYRNPLLSSADSLERQINTIVRARGQSWLDSEYYRMSTFYKFGLFLFWVRRIELNVGYLDMGSSKMASEFTSRLYSPFKGLSSIRSYFKEEPYAAETALPRDISRAIGEEMYDFEHKLSNKDGPIGFSHFVRRYGSEEQFRVWFDFLDQILRNMLEDKKPVQVERLIVTGAHLKRLMSLLDPKGIHTSQGYSNLDILQRRELIDELSKEGIS